MADNNKTDVDMPDDPMNEQPLISHLVELRNRTVRAAIAVIVVFAVLSPFMRTIFDYLSQPLMVALPQGVKLLATGVVAPFMVPLKGLVLCALSGLGLYCPSPLSPRKAFSITYFGFIHCDVCLRYGVLLLHRFPYGVSVHRRILSS